MRRVRTAVRDLVDVLVTIGVHLGLTGWRESTSPTEVTDRGQRLTRRAGRAMDAP